MATDHSSGSGQSPASRGGSWRNQGPQCHSPPSLQPSARSSRWLSTPRRWRQRSPKPTMPSSQVSSPRSERVEGRHPVPPPESPGGPQEETAGSPRPDPMRARDGTATLHRSPSPPSHPLSHGVSKCGLGNLRRSGGPFRGSNVKTIFLITLRSYFPCTCLLSQGVCRGLPRGCMRRHRDLKGY